MAAKPPHAHFFSFGARAEKPQTGNCHTTWLLCLRDGFAVETVAATEQIKSKSYPQKRWRT
jgi:hypothetical protein